MSGITETKMVTEVNKAQIASAMINWKQRIRNAATIAPMLPSVSARMCRYRAYLFQFLLSASSSSWKRYSPVRFNISPPIDTTIISELYCESGSQSLWPCCITSFAEYTCPLYTVNAILPTLLTKIFRARIQRKTAFASPEKLSIFAMK